MNKKPKKRAASSNTIRLIPVGVKPIDECWSVYQLADGNKVRVRPVVTDVEQHEGKLGLNGEPVYQVKAGLIIEIIHKKKGRKKS